MYLQAERQGVGPPPTQGTSPLRRPNGFSGFLLCRYQWVSKTLKRLTPSRRTVSLTTPSFLISPRPLYNLTVLEETMTTKLLCGWGGLGGRAPQGLGDTGKFLAPSYLIVNLAQA